MQESTITQLQEESLFSGNIFIFHAFDVGDDINLEMIQQAQLVKSLPIVLPKYFKNYHVPLSIELPSHTAESKCISSKIHHFGALSLTYQIPFVDTLENIRKRINSLDTTYRKQSASDAASIYRKIKDRIKQPHFFHLRSSYVVIQIDPKPQLTNIVDLKNKYGGLIASTMRFETENLSEFQKSDILEAATGYYRGDLIIIDTEAAFVYDTEYYEILDLFEFGNLHKLELNYFDRLLDQHLNMVYELRAINPPVSAYLPFISISDPIGDLGRLKVDVSVIAERLESSIKLAGEPYYTEIYALLADKLDLKTWKDSIDKKLAIIKEIREVYYNKIDVIREDLLSVLIILLILIEIIVAIWKK
jgi:hypothetical protein